MKVLGMFLALMGSIFLHSLFLVAIAGKNSLEWIELLF